MFVRMGRSDRVTGALGALFLFLCVGACTRVPTQVYIPASTPRVELHVGASDTIVAVGTPVILHAERTYRGEWTRIARDSLATGQCWLASPPPASEAEVADNVRWIAIPKRPPMLCDHLRAFPRLGPRV
jgi:hypothetical protein